MGQSNVEKFELSHAYHIVSHRLWQTDISLIRTTSNFEHNLLDFHLVKDIVSFHRFGKRHDVVKHKASTYQSVSCQEDREEF